MFVLSPVRTNLTIDALSDQALNLMNAVEVILPHVSFADWYRETHEREILHCILLRNADQLAAILVSLHRGLSSIGIPTDWNGQDVPDGVRFHEMLAEFSV